MSVRETLLGLEMEVIKSDVRVSNVRSFPSMRSVIIHGMHRSIARPGLFQGNLYDISRSRHSSSPMSPSPARSRSEDHHTHLPCDLSIHVFRHHSCLLHPHAAAPTSRAIFPFMCFVITHVSFTRTQPPGGPPQPPPVRSFHSCVSSSLMSPSPARSRPHLPCDLSIHVFRHHSCLLHPHAVEVDSKLGR
jgi:hypothetical protein